MGEDRGRSLRDPLSERELEILDGLKQGATDREIAQKLHLSLNTVKWYNRQIYAKLDVKGRQEAVEAADRLGLLAQDEAPEFPAPAIPNNLPALDLTSFVGREQEVARLKDLVRSKRLVTLTGPGGVGKTRLALQVASNFLPDFEEGVYVVDLAPLDDPELVAAAIGHVLDVGERGSEPMVDTLGQALKQKAVLLILDNFEQVMEAASLIPRLLDRSPGLRIMATSRSRLGLYGEQLFPVEPLDNKEAVDLFGDRARALDPDFVPGEDGEGTIRELCQTLDNLPLAIELAAARTSTLTPLAILRQLGSGLDAFKSPEFGRPRRHRSLEAALDWSYELLESDEQIALQSLAVFAGGASLAAVEAVCAARLAGEPLEALDSLMDKNLIRREVDADESPRFSVLETVRQYSKAKLQEGGLEEEFVQKHMDYFISFGEEMWEFARHDVDPDSPWWRQEQLEAENLRVAFERAVEHGEKTIAFRLLTGVMGAWLPRSPVIGLRWGRLAFGLEGEVSKATQGRAYNWIGTLNWQAGDSERARDAYEKAVEVLRDSDGKFDLALALGLLGSVYADDGDLASAEECLVESHSLFSGVEGAFGLKFVLNAWGELRRLQGRFVEAKDFYLQAREVVADESVEFNLASVSRSLGEVEAAMSHALNSLEIAVTKARRTSTCSSLDMIAGLLTPLNPRAAARWMGASSRVRSESGAVVGVVDKPLYEADLANLRHLLGDEAFERAWEEGQSIPLDQAVRAARDLAHESSEVEVSNSHSLPRDPP